MDGNKIIGYVVIFILYIIFQIIKNAGKKKASVNQPAAKKAEAETSQTNRSKPLINQPTSGPASKPQPSPQPQPEPFSLEEILKQFGQVTETKAEEVKSEEWKEMKAESLEMPKGKIIDYDEDLEEEEQSMENAPITKSGDSVFGKDEHFTPYSAEAPKENKIAAMLKDPEGLKAAFIAGEIFNRKY